MWCQGIAQGMLPKLIHPSYRIFIVVFLINDWTFQCEFWVSKKKRGTFQQHLATSARHVSPDQGTFLRPTMPTWSSGCLIHVKPYELPRCPCWNSCHWVAQIAKLIYFQMLRACEKIWELFHQHHANFGHSCQYLDILGTDSTQWEGCSTEGTNIKSSFRTATLNVFDDSGMIWCWWVANHTFLSCPLAVWSTLCLAYLVSGLVTWGSTYC